tara:strand:- start:785 stop:1024 length:240 start_codon:yes stop_codon:yes gene_type:complete
MRDNKLIAEFMGDKPKDLLYRKLYVDYSRSWDVLMPVINKCYQEHMSEHISDAVMTCDINKAYKVVVTFINEYNRDCKL